MIKVESLSSLAHYQQDATQHLALPNAASCGSSGYSLQKGSSAVAFWSVIAANTGVPPQSSQQQPLHQDLSNESSTSYYGERATNINSDPVAIAIKPRTPPRQSVMNVEQSLPSIRDDNTLSERIFEKTLEGLKPIPLLRLPESLPQVPMINYATDRQVPYKPCFRRRAIREYRLAMAGEHVKRKSELNEEKIGSESLKPAPRPNSYFLLSKQANELIRKHPRSLMNLEDKHCIGVESIQPSRMAYQHSWRDRNHDNEEENDFSILNIIPTLISEKHRKAAFVENLVDSAALIIEVIWSHFHINPAAKIIPLSIFLQETLRRSRTSYSTLQTGLFYLYRIKEKITSRAFQLPATNQKGGTYQYPLTPMSETPSTSQRRENNDPATCGRRMFLAALIVASKYLQDRNYSNKAWSKISGLPVSEINQNEIIFLKLIDYNLFISEDIFKRWSSLLLTHIQAISGSTMDNANAFKQAENQLEVERFRDTLRHMDPKTMECRRNHGGGFSGPLPITPNTSAPGSPREERSDSDREEVSSDMDTDLDQGQMEAI